jgi:transcriptional regulator with XRE-family HTH domain
MEEINADWLRKRIGSDRGVQAELSRSTGISPDKISKILNGTRQVQASEVPLLYDFFIKETASALLSERERELLSLFSQLSDEEQAFLLKSAKGLNAAAQPEE